MSGKLLKLKAEDNEDVQVISAVLQDAIVPVCDMIYKADEKNFVMVVHRLCREEGNLERICCAVNVRGVESAQLQSIDLTKQGDMLDLLAAMPDEKAVTFVFAGGAKIRLHLDNWLMIVEDFGEPWPVQCNPCHDSDRATG